MHQLLEVRGQRSASATQTKAHTYTKPVGGACGAASCVIDTQTVLYMSRCRADHIPGLQLKQYPVCLSEASALLCLLMISVYK